MIGYQLRARFFDEAAFAANPLKLLPTRSKKCPATEPLQPVPRKYLGLQGEHEAHPGTGLGYGAKKRLNVA
jgi:DNA (cytosine-5)-methyltransferase 1